MSAREYAWYDIANPTDPLLQGDVIRQCPILVPIWHGACDFTEGSTVEVEKFAYDVVVMSQSCDLIHKKLNLVLVSPLFTLLSLSKKNPEYGTPKGKESLRRGFQPNYHLIASPDEGIFGDRFLVVDFRSVYGVGADYLVEFVTTGEKRFRLLPPYREHLSQAFARFFMRVGLPTDIPKFTS